MTQLVQPEPMQAQKTHGPTSRRAQSGHAPVSTNDANGRVVLMLQGAASQFHWTLACALRNRGARVLKVHLCAGEWIFWPGKSISYRGRPQHWRPFAAELMRENAVTDLILFGDCRFYHAEAIEAARELGVRLHLFEEGYLRPHWMTLEHHGVNAFSDFPRDPQVLLAEAALLGAAPKVHVFHDRFALRALWDVAWNSSLLLGALAYPFYRRHAVLHPVLEYAGWLRQFARKRAIAERDAVERTALEKCGAPYYVFPLQLDGDFQIRVHSAFRDMQEAAEMVFASFARAAPPHARLMVKRHPFDVPLRDRRRQIEAMAARHGFAERLTFIESGDIVPLIAASAGTLVVNSTSATFAMNQGVPVKVLGRAMYDIPGLSFQGPLDDFWTKAAPPDAELWAAFRRVLLERTQINGRFFCEDGIAAAVAGASERIIRAPAPAPVDRA